MNREILEQFLGKKIKLVLNENFCLYGIIDMVYEDCIVFTTNQKTSAISFNRIMEVVPL